MVPWRRGGWLQRWWRRRSISRRFRGIISCGCWKPTSKSDARWARPRLHAPVPPRNLILLRGRLNLQLSAGQLPDRTQMPNQWKFDCDMAVDGDITEIKIWVDTEFLLRIIDPRYSLNIDDTISLSNKQSVTASMQYVLANVAGPIYDN